MGSSLIRRGLPVSLFGFLFPVFAQTSPAETPPATSTGETATYESFFRLVAQLKSLSDRPQVALRINGGLASVTLPRIQDVIGLTDAEADLLNRAAADCVFSVNSLLKPQAIVFESRLQQIESGRTSDSLAALLKDLEQQHRQLILGHVQQLKVAFGDARFQVLDAYVHSPGSKRSLLPVAKPLGAAVK